MGLTQPELAQRIGVHRNTLARYEQGRLIPRREHLEALIRETDLPTDALVRPQKYLEDHPDFLIAYAEQPRRGRPPQPER